MKTLPLRWRLAVSFAGLLLMGFAPAQPQQTLTLLLLGLPLAGLAFVWCLAPLERINRELEAVRVGKQKKLSFNYPPELKAITQDLNAFIELSDDRLKRYRKRLDDLAHSFKTPLAIQRTAVESEPDPVELRRIVLAQVERMNQSVSYHLKRAATDGQLSIGKAIDIKATAQKLLTALQLKYTAKILSYKIDIADKLTFPGAEGDLLEILGNLGDNACKAATSQVKLSAYQNNQRLIIQVEDDGKGIPVDQRERVLQRGRRGEGYQEGSGIGLALVSDIATENYQGRVEITDSALGGACVRVLLQCKGRQ